MHCEVCGLNTKKRKEVIHMAEKAKRKALAGTGVEIYLDNAFPRKRGKEGELGVNIVPRKRRDVDPDAPYAGAYIVNASYGPENNRKVTNNQFVKLDVYNKMRDVSGLDPLTQEDLQAVMPQYDEAGEKIKAGKSLVNRQEPVVFKTNVFSNDKEKGLDGQWSHLINQQVIEPSAKPDFSFEAEAALGKAKREERLAAKEAAPEQAPEAPAVAKEENEPTF